MMRKKRGVLMYTIFKNKKVEELKIKINIQIEMADMIEKRIKDIEDNKVI